jgi:hypothetical protein
MYYEVIWRAPNKLEMCSNVLYDFISANVVFLTGTCFIIQTFLKDTVYTLCGICASYDVYVMSSVHSSTCGLESSSEVALSVEFLINAHHVTKHNTPIHNIL